MSESDISRVADLHLRGVDRLLPARVYWPGHHVTAPALVVHLGSPADAAEICRDGYIVLAVDAPVEEAQRIVEWAAAHGPELGASHRLVAAGPGAIDIVRRTRQADWPPIELLPAEFADSDATKREGESPRTSPPPLKASPPREPAIRRNHDPRFGQILENNHKEIR